MLIQMSWEFFKTGLFAVGGGLATLPFLYDMSARTGWFSTRDIANMVAVSESTPGPLGVNMSSYVGFTAMGVLGSIVTTCSLVLPSVICILIIARVLDRFKNAAVVQQIFYGIRPASAALIAAAGLQVAKISLLNISSFHSTDALMSLFNWKMILLAAVVLAAYKKFSFHPIVYILAAGAVGVIIG